MEALMYIAFLTNPLIILISTPFIMLGIISRIISKDILLVKYFQKNEYKVKNDFIKSSIKKCLIILLLPLLLIAINIFGLAISLYWTISNNDTSYLYIICGHITFLIAGIFLLIILSINAAALQKWNKTNLKLSDNRLIENLIDYSDNNQEKQLLLNNRITIVSKIFIGNNMTVYFTFSSKFQNYSLKKQQELIYELAVQNYQFTRDKQGMPISLNSFKDLFIKYQIKQS
ncbi:MAG0920 family protein [Mycoplasmopsis opalescens]|uniref:MAG0920 family protein n=1 Tax=Mycoplasmopsis opalescens TaxID=114886 RepID=UPI0004A6BCFB|nr:hypothetical protein [Mycoplasmopsis opalescens]